MKERVKFFLDSDFLSWIFGKRYILSVVDAYGNRDSKLPSEEIERKMFETMQARGFKVLWKAGTRYGFMVLVIRNKAEEAQLALMNTGVIEVEIVPVELPVFKV